VAGATSPSSSSLEVISAVRGTVGDSAASAATAVSTFVIDCETNNRDDTLMMCVQ
jgi:hypothetical protein